MKTVHKQLILFSSLLWSTYSFWVASKIPQSAFVCSNVHSTTQLLSVNSAFPDELDRNSDLMNAMAEMTTSSSSLLGRKSLGVDFGLVRTGLAVSIGYDATPLNTVANLNNTQLCQHIIKLVESEKAKQIVVGLPFHKNGTEAEQTVITREFATALICATCAHFGPDKIPIYLWDERYTSKEAAARKRAANPRANLFKELDADAACIILEYYYQDDGRGAIKVELPNDESTRHAVNQAWLMKIEEGKQQMKDLRQMRMNATNDRRAMMERAKLLDERLAKEQGRLDEGLSKSSNKKKRKKK